MNELRESQNKMTKNPTFTSLVGAVGEGEVQSQELKVSLASNSLANFRLLAYRSSTHEQHHSDDN